MTEVIHLAEDYNEALAALQSLTRWAVTASDSLEQEISSLEEDWSEEWESASGSLLELEEELSEGESGMEKLGGEIKEILTGFSGEMETADGMVEALDEGLEQAGKAVTSAVQEGAASAIAACAGLEEALRSAGKAVGVVMEGARASQGTLEDGLERVATALLEFQQGIEGVASGVSVQFEELTASLEGELHGQAVQAVEHLTGILGEQLAVEAKSAFDHTMEQGNQLFRSFEEITESLALEIEDAAQEILEALASHVADGASRQVSEAVEDVVREAIGKLGVKLAELSTVALAGASTSGVLSPILPQLAAAKAVVQTVQRVLSALGALF